jgi:hypothetical protein
VGAVVRGELGEVGHLLQWSVVNRGRTSRTKARA